LGTVIRVNNSHFQIYYADGTVHHVRTKGWSAPDNGLRAPQNEVTLDTLATIATLRLDLIKSS